MEIGAVVRVNINGMVMANGGAGGLDAGSSDIYGGGGGSGGGILVHAPTVSLTGSLSAIGGEVNGDHGRVGGAGSGGRVLILTADGTLESGGLDANVNVSGGSKPRRNGPAGTKELETGSIFNQAPGAQCQSVTVAAGASCAASASIDNGSFDLDSGDRITVTQSPAGHYPLGSTNVTLTVTDSQGLFSSCSAVVTVVNNDPPSLGNYPNFTGAVGGSATVTPNSPPSDNGSISNVTVMAPGFTGTATGDAATGAVSISNAGPIGGFLIIVTATDNCGAQITRNFTLIVAAPICGITVNPATLPQPYVAVPYARILSASQLGSYTFSVSSGELPPGLQVVTALGVSSIAGLPTTPGTYSFTIMAKKNGTTCEATRSYTLTIPATVAPILECVQHNDNGSYTARFGYDNSTGAVVTIPVGANNFFTPGAQNRGQVTVFNPGRVTNAFSVTFNSSGGNLGVWFLKGPDGVTRPVNITTATLGCP